MKMQKFYNYMQPIIFMYEILFVAQHFVSSIR